MGIFDKLKEKANQVSRDKLRDQLAKQKSQADVIRAELRDRKDLAKLQGEKAKLDKLRSEQATGLQKVAQNVSAGVKAYLNKKPIQASASNIKIRPKEPPKKQGPSFMTDRMF